MGLRGPVAKSAELRIVEGERAHRPLPPTRSLAAGVPERPKGMPAAARRIWDDYVEQMAQLGTLRPVDGFALRRLCEDGAMLLELQKGMRKMASATKRQDSERIEQIETALKAAEGETRLALEAEASEIRIRLIAPLLALAKTHDGRRITATINALASRVQRQELQFGLTPASAARVEGNVILPPAATGGEVPSIEAALCG